MTNSKERERTRDRSLFPEESVRLQFIDWAHRHKMNVLNTPALATKGEGPYGHAVFRPSYNADNAWRFAQAQRDDLIDLIVGNDAVVAPIIRKADIPKNIAHARDHFSFFHMLISNYQDAVGKPHLESKLEAMATWFSFIEEINLDLKRVHIKVCKPTKYKDIDIPADDEAKQFFGGIIPAENIHEEKAEVRVTIHDPFAEPTVAQALEVEYRAEDGKLVEIGNFFDIRWLRRDRKTKQLATVSDIDHLHSAGFVESVYHEDVSLRNHYSGTWGLERLASALAGCDMCDLPINRTILTSLNGGIPFYPDPEDLNDEQQQKYFLRYYRQADLIRTIVFIANEAESTDEMNYLKRLINDFFGVRPVIDYEYIPDSLRQVITAYVSAYPDLAAKSEVIITGIIHKLEEFRYKTAPYSQPPEDYPDQVLVKKFVQEKFTTPLTCKKSPIYVSLRNRGLSGVTAFLDMEIILRELSIEYGLSYRPRFIKSLETLCERLQSRIGWIREKAVRTFIEQAEIPPSDKEKVISHILGIVRDEVSKPLPAEQAIYNPLALRLNALSPLAVVSDSGSPYAREPLRRFESAFDTDIRHFLQVEAQKQRMIMKDDLVKDASTMLTNSPFFRSFLKLYKPAEDEALVMMGIGHNYQIDSSIPNAAYPGQMGIYTVDTLARAFQTAGCQVDFERREYGTWITVQLPNGGQIHMAQNLSPVDCAGEALAQSFGDKLRGKKAMMIIDRLDVWFGRWISPLPKGNSSLPHPGIRSVARCLGLPALFQIGTIGDIRTDYDVDYYLNEPFLLEDYSRLLSKQPFLEPYIEALNLYCKRILLALPSVALFPNS